MRPALLWSNGYCQMILRGGDGGEETILCTVIAYSWIGDDLSTIFCGEKGIFAQPPHSAHMWAPFAFIIIHFSFCKATNCLHWRFKRENVCIRKSSLKLRIDERTFPTNLKFVRKNGFVTCDQICMILSNNGGICFEKNCVVCKQQIITL